MFAMVSNFWDVIHQVKTPIQLVALALVVMYALFRELAKGGHVPADLVRYSFYLLLLAVTCSFAVLVLPIIAEIIHPQPLQLTGNVEDKDNQQVGVPSEVKLQIPGSSTRHAHANDDGYFAFPLEQTDLTKEGTIWAEPLDKTRYGPSTSLPVRFTKSDTHPSITIICSSASHTRDESKRAEGVGG
jgi:hypothetical protein